MRIRPKSQEPSLCEVNKSLAYGKKNAAIKPGRVNYFFEFRFNPYMAEQSLRDMDSLHACFFNLSST